MPNDRALGSKRPDRLLERRRLRTEVDEHQVAPASNGDRREGAVVRAQPGFVTEVAGRLQLAVPVERPAVVPTHEVPGRPRPGPHDHPSAVRTDVVEATQRTISFDDDEDRDPGDLLGDVLPGPFQRRRRGEHQPLALPHRPPLAGVNVVVAVPRGRERAGHRRTRYRASRAPSERRRPSCRARPRAWSTEQQEAGAEEGDQQRTPTEVADTVLAGGLGDSAADQGAEHTDDHRVHAPALAPRGSPTRRTRRRSAPRRSSRRCSSVS